MSIHAISSNDLLRSIYAAAYAPPLQEEGQGSQSVTSDHAHIDISFTGKLMNSISQMSDEEKTEMETFRQELTEAVQSGNFDAETMAASAPDALSDFAEENGLDLTQMIQKMADGLENNAGIYGPPPPSHPELGMGGPQPSSLTDLTDDEKAALQSFMEELSSSVEDGSFDAETTAASAPDTLSSLAEENGIELTELIQSLADKIEDAENTPPPPPPPMMDGANGNINLLSKFFLKGSSNNTTSIKTA